MFKYFIESIESESQQPEVNNHRSETLLLASSRSQPNHQQYYEHSRMFREDYQGLFYRKLNAIIQLESLQQVLEQNEGILGQLSSTCLGQIVAKRDIKSLESSQFKKENECGVVMMAKEMVLLHSKVRRQWNLLRKKAQLEHEAVKIAIDKKSLIEQVKIFASKLNEVLLENINEDSCSEVERVLLEHARKYNLSKVISSFMDELKSTIVGSSINEMIASLLKNSSEDLKSSIKIEQLKLFCNPYKNRKELVNNLTLYLKQFYSSNIYKEFTEIISRLTREYEVAKLKSNFLSKKLTDQIDNNVKLLGRVLKEIAVKSGEIMDYKIDIEILTEEIKLIERNLWIAEQSMAEYINKETEMLLTEYLIHEGKLFRQDITTQKLTEMADYKYFKEQLTTKYKQFLVEHLRKAEEIEKMKEKIDNYSLILASYEKQLNMIPTPEQSQHTYRTLNDHSDKKQLGRGGLMRKVSCEDQVFEEQSQEQSPQKQSSHQTVINQIQSNNSLDKQSRDRNLQCGQLALKDVDYNTFSPERQPRKKQYESCGQMALKMTALLNQCQRKQKFIVSKVVNIGCKVIDPSNLFKKHKNNREYQAKLSKKYLILQPINQQTLSICEKIQWGQIKKYTPNYHMATLILQYSGCRVLLNFITFNMDVFVKRLEKVYRQPKV